MISYNRCFGVIGEYVVKKLILKKQKLRLFVRNSDKLGWLNKLINK